MKKLAYCSLALLLALCLGAASAEESGILGKPFPEFTAADTQGNTFTLSDALKDHEAVVINFWATWCPPCEFEVQFLEEAYAQYGDRVAFICLSGEEDDTLEKIETYRERHGLTLPMGRDEGAALFSSIGAVAYPTTVIVDRFGNVAFCHEMMFKSTRELSSAIEVFLGDGYAETAVLDGIPEPDATGAFPVAASREVFLENEGARQLFFKNDAPPSRLKAFVVNDSVAHLRMELPASDNPYNMICCHWNDAALHEMPTLLDPSGSGYSLDVPIPDGEGDPAYAIVCLMEWRGDTSEDLNVYLIRSEDSLDKLCEQLAQDGWTLTEEAGEAAAPDAPQAYVLHVVDQYGDPVPGTIVNFCTDTACAMAQSDDSGTITFDGAPEAYHVQLLKVPEGYSFDAGFELNTGKTYGEWRLCVRKD